MRENHVFVKLNLKTIGEIKGLIIDKEGLNIDPTDRYMICAGKCNKDGWTIVFKAKSYKEAEDIIEKTHSNKSIYPSGMFIQRSTVVC